MGQYINVNGRKISRVQIRGLAAKLPLRSEDWRDDAKCRGEDPTLLVYASDFPTERQRKKLTELCSNCPVVESCRYEGLRTMSEGWWGGMTPEERYEWAVTVLFVDELQK